MQTTDRHEPPTDRPAGVCWREVMEAGAETGGAEGLALEQVIDRQRLARPQDGWDR